ncbi:putative MADS-box protein SOC1-like isoform X1 [Capsicum annuum]|nr:putative MADS-box protein SOC1-like isoform X1 [Capsicum annuum]KAF3684489.1 putative MADS-box protein SOC1-like isoform X1 [Capsicum annuum]
MQEVIDRYKRHTKDRVQPENQADAQNLQTQVFKEQVERLKEKEKILTAENAKLREKFVGLQQNQTPSEDKEGEAVCTDSSEKSDVETELIIGPPESRTRRLLQN